MLMLIHLECNVSSCCIVHYLCTVKKWLTCCPRLNFLFWAVCSLSVCNYSGTRIKTRKRNIAAPLDPAAFSDAVVQIYLDNAGDLVNIYTHTLIVSSLLFLLACFGALVPKGWGWSCYHDLHKISIFLCAGTYCSEHWIFRP